MLRRRKEWLLLLHPHHLHNAIARVADLLTFMLTVVSLPANRVTPAVLDAFDKAAKEYKDIMKNRLVPAPRPTASSSSSSRSSSNSGNASSNNGGSSSTGSSNTNNSSGSSSLNSSGSSNNTKRFGWFTFGVYEHALYRHVPTWLKRTLDTKITLTDLSSSYLEATNHTVKLMLSHHSSQGGGRHPGTDACSDLRQVLQYHSVYCHPKVRKHVRQPVAYNCAQCGEVKKGHDCAARQATSTLEALMAVVHTPINLDAPGQSPFPDLPAASQPFTTPTDTAIAGAANNGAVNAASCHVVLAPERRQVQHRPMTSASPPTLLPTAGQGQRGVTGLFGPATPMAGQLPPKPPKARIQPPPQPTAAVAAALVAMVQSRSGGTALQPHLARFPAGQVPTLGSILAMQQASAILQHSAVQAMQRSLDIQRGLAMQQVLRQNGMAGQQAPTPALPQPVAAAAHPPVAANPLIQHSHVNGRDADAV